MIDCLEDEHQKPWEALGKFSTSDVHRQVGQELCERPLLALRFTIFSQWTIPLIRQTFELGKFISTAGKSIINLVKWSSLVEKYRKMWKI